MGVLGFGILSILGISAWIANKDEEKFAKI